MEQMKTIKRYKAVQLFVSLYKIRLIRILIPMFFIAFIYFEGQNKLRQIHLSMTLVQLRSIEPVKILLILGLSLIAVSSMFGYDLLIRKHLRLAVPFSKLFQYAWIANTFNNFLGFAGFTGASIRIILYKKQQVPAKKMLVANAFLAPALIVGLSVLAWFVILGILPVKAIFAAHKWLIPELWGMALYLIFFLLIQRSNWLSKWMSAKKETISWGIVLASTTISFVEWVFAGMVFWFVGYEISGSLSFQVALGIYVISAIAGLISLAPGGLGSFDLTALIGMEAFGVNPATAAAVLVIFRLFYFIIPWLLGLALTVKVMIPTRERVNEWTSSVWGDSLNRWQQLWRWPGQFRFLSDLGVAALSIFVFASGMLLLFSASIPGLLSRLKFTEHLLTLPFMNLSHQLSIIIGIILVILARGVRYRVKRAYHLTLFMLIAGAIFTFTKGFDFEEALFLIFVAILLWISRARFYREAAPFSANTFITLASLTVLVVLVYLSVGLYVHPIASRLDPERLIRHFFYRPGDLFLSAIIGLAGGWAFLITWYFLRPNRKIEQIPMAKDLEKVEAFFKENQGNMLAHLVLLGDKSLFWAMDGQVLIAYARTRDKLVVLGDPIGESRIVKQAIEEFQQFADRYALTTVFYQVSPESLPIYHETGYRFFKLGEEALVDLSAFTLKGKKQTSFRTARNKLEREGYSFEVRKPPYTDDYLEQLRKVSDEWMGDRKEKGFSLGRFSESYMRRSMTAVIFDPTGEVISFASLMPSYDKNLIISIDLMRHLHHIPNGTMDVLFTRMFDWAKLEGYRFFNLGMAPLSNVGHTSNALREEKWARLVFQYGNHWYGFEGLRRYKQKFSPNWEPRYLAFPPSVNLPLLMMDLVKLVSRRQNASIAEKSRINQKEKSAMFGITARKD